MVNSTVATKLFSDKIESWVTTNLNVTTLCFDDIQCSQAVVVEIFLYLVFLFLKLTKLMQT